MIAKGRGLLKPDEVPLTPGHADGTIATEYTAKLIFVILVVMVAASALGGKVTEIFTAVAGAIS